MGLGPRLDLRQSQSLVLTPQLQQAIKLLALSNLELEGVIAEEVEKNPLLEALAPEDPSAGDIDRPEPVELASAAMREDTPADQLIASGAAETDAPLDVDYGAETFHHDSATDSVRGLDGGLGLDGGGPGGGGGFDDTGFDTIADAGLSLHDHLIAQIGMILSGRDLAIALALIEQIDEAGYLVAPPLDIANLLGVPLVAVDTVLARVQALDPAGVGARDLAECLALQAKEADRYDPCMARLIANLDLLARGALPQLRRLCDVDEEDLADMIRELRAYDPKPGLRFGQDVVQAIVPDLFIARTRAGWAIELNSATLPRLLVNRSYYVELAGTAKSDKASKVWLSECLASANWLVKALDQRARTIIKVATELVKQQEGFFLHGVTHLKPLTLRTVADVIGMHESTVSRVTSNKYLSCDRGVFELKYFFTSGVPSGDGESAAAEAVKSRIARLIADEGAQILSDDKLVDLLRADGFDIARRTVAKYREAIGLGSSVERRRQRVLRG